VKNPLIRFFVIGTILYFGWYFFYELYLLPSTAIDEMLVDLLVRGAESFLRLLNFDLRVFDDGLYRNHIAIDGTAGVTVGAPCDGMILMALFIIFVSAYPGTNKNRLWFIPLGLFVIQFMNVLRIMALAFIVYWNEDYLAFNHDYTFTALVYAVVFAFWWWWSKMYVPAHGNPEEK
jgi:exosortase/archaeosortase family protein